MNVIRYPDLDEQIYRDVLPNGLSVQVISRPGFTRKLAYFVTDFGSIHREFTLGGQEYRVPAGIAHFLEHKMFELPDRDVTAEFAAMGAVPNAFTSYDMTAYYFSCTERFEDNLRLLLEFVSTPYFTEESVQREMGIIDQEIGMNEDTPDSCLFEKLMESMYQVHPIRLPILGTRESIREITPELLTLCHQAFYNPANMILCVVGDVVPERVVKIARQVLGDERKEAGKKNCNWQETLACKEPMPELNMEVSMPMFQICFKSEPLGKGDRAVRREIIGDLAAEALFGESSELYLQLYQEGNIDSSFGGGFETVDGCAMLTCGGDSETPEAIRSAILEQAEKLGRQGIPLEDFLRMKRSALGRRIRDLDSFDSTCFRICAYHFSDFDYFRFPEIYESVTAEEVQEFLVETVKASACAMGIVNPLV